MTLKGRKTVLTTSCYLNKVLRLSLMIWKMYLPKYSTQSTRSHTPSVSGRPRRWAGSRTLLAPEVFWAFAWASPSSAWPRSPTTSSSASASCSRREGQVSATQVTKAIKVQMNKEFENELGLYSLTKPLNNLYPILYTLSLYLIKA